MSGYYFIDYCPQCGGGYKVCRTNDNYEYSINMNWHSVNPDEVWSFDYYEDAFEYARGRLDRVGSVNVSSRALKHRDRNIVKDSYTNTVKFPITTRRKMLSESERKQLVLAEARAQAMADAIYFINLYDSKAKALDAIVGNKKYWENVAKNYKEKERGYVA